MRRDAIATGVSLAAHAGALGLLFVATMPAHRVAIDVAIVDHPRAAAPSAAAPSAAPPPPASTPPRHTHARRTIAVAPAPAADAPPLPVADEGAEVALDDSDDGPEPAGGNEATPGAAGGTGSGVGTSDRSRAPDLDRESCTRDLNYPWRAQLLDKEGIVRLRVTLDDTGKVRDAVVVDKADYGFDEAAVKALLTMCRFTAALDRDGRPTSFVIDDYRFYFRFSDFARMPRFAQPR
jgi:protein TonB